ncbi:MAG: MvdD family ATP-grasp ribosomal peptide maturase [Acaryochloris sp. RU_4_1]|nr:MvdD family ATP-grasp ribosomal peptide maturase [Acaryochloris sp. RU_4_1]NJR56572.1 MvdD family ATP-grasp ribosomal peptide maturase [Acaryochloris sp. CRU_2_0]
MTVLIITYSQDNESIPLVLQAIAAQGGQAFRLDTDRFPTEVKLDIHYDRGTERLMLVSDQGTLDLQDVSAVWYRRIRMGNRIPTTMNPQLRQASVQEASVTIQGMIASLKAFHLDPVHHLRRAEHKQLQLQLACNLGLEIPRTLITNNPEAVLKFAQTCESGMITKMLSSFAIYEDDQEKVVFTNPVTPADLDNLDGLQFCPMTFQEQIPKVLELRTTIVGKRVFTAAIDSQRLEQAHYDWRRKGIALLKDWQSYTLPPEIEEKLLLLMTNLGLNYGAIDIILTPDNRYVFLEINPVGEFFWLERCPGLPISQEIANLLLRGSHTNSPIK